MKGNRVVPYVPLLMKSSLVRLRKGLRGVFYLSHVGGL